MPFEPADRESDFVDGRTRRDGGILSATLPVLAIAAISLIGATAAAMSVDSSRDDRLAAIFPPWWNDQRIMAAMVEADARVMRTGALDSIVLTTSDSDGLTARLKAAGALAVFDTNGAAACLGLSRSSAVASGLKQKTI